MPTETGDFKPGFGPGVTVSPNGIQLIKPTDPLTSNFKDPPTAKGPTTPPSSQTRKNAAPNADKPSIAHVDPSMDLNSALQQVGTSGQVFPKLISILTQVKGIMAMMHTTSPASSSSATNTNNNETINTLINALTGALTIISNGIGFDNVISTLIATFANGATDNLESNYTSVVSESIINLIDSAIAQGNTQNLPYTATPGYNTIPSGSIPPSPINSLPPDHYVQQFFSISNDPYPGYVQWQGPSGDYVYTIRTSDYPNYASALEAVTGNAQIQLVNALNPPLQVNILSVTQLNVILDSVYQYILSSGQDSVLGNNSSSGGGANIMAIAIQLLGAAGSLMNNGLNNIPSQANIGSLTSTIQNAAKTLSMVQQMKNISLGAVNIPSPLGALGSLGSLGGALSTISSSVSTLNSIVSSLGVLTNVTGSLSGNVNITSALGSISAITNNLTNNIGGLSSVSGIVNNVNTLNSISQTLNSPNLTSSDLTNVISSISSTSSSLNGFGTITLNANNGLSVNSINMLISIGLSQLIISTLNNLCISNGLSQESITSICSIATSLNEANFTQQSIIRIITLLAEVI